MLEGIEGYALGDERRNVDLTRERLLDGGEQLGTRGARRLPPRVSPSFGRMFKNSSFDSCILKLGS